VPNAAPNLTHHLLPVLANMRSMVQNKTGQYSTENVFQRGGERSKFEVEAQLNQVATLNITSLNLFYEPWERLLREMMRRVMDKGYPLQLDGGGEVREMRKRLEDRGVPLEALEQVDLSSLKAVRAVGAGSSAARQVTNQRIFELSSSFDQVGRAAAVRDLTVSLVGHQTADRYAPKPDTAERIPLNAKFAGLENLALHRGDQVVAYENDTHILHINSHLGEMEDIDLAIEAGEADLMESVPALVAFHGHSSQHLSFIEGDPTLEAQANATRQILQQKGETIHNGIKALQAQQRKTGEDPEAAQSLDESGAKIAQQQQELDQREEKHQQEMRMREDRARQDLAIADAKNALALQGMVDKMGG
ncbi:MAG: hypothetical protein Q8R28_19695, partial [Dehalococcoidia bacterium]|nr:hypothetical protein [Dehalococcoidia bacterium]